MKKRIGKKRKIRGEAWKDLAISAAIMCIIAAIMVIIKVMGVFSSLTKDITPKDLFWTFIIFFILLDFREIKTIITGKASHPSKD